MPTQDTPILIIDDEEIVLLAISESLIPEGYRIVKTTSPQKGLEYLMQEEFAVIISDHHMPGMTGLEFFAEANKIQPMASRILITGVLTLKVVVDAINKGEIFRFIAKPWIREELLATVRNATHRYELVFQNAKLQKETQSSNSELTKQNRDLEAEIKDLRARERFREKVASRSEKNLKNALELMLRIIHNIDPGLGREASLIVSLCQAMIETGDIPEETAEILGIASYMVALGKIGIEKKKLKEFTENPHLLRGEDQEYFHNIPVYSQLHASFFEEMPGLSETVRASHERMDGRGYPDGLSAKKIPEAAKYLSIAVFYAESAQSTQQTLDQIRQLSGTAFDPEAVALFLQSDTGIELNKKKKTVNLTQLKPGMVIGEDLRYPSGAVFLPRGSSLSDATITMMKNSAPTDTGKSTFLIYS
jgi:response regulator RpfG family c-di-GMP phosphodiesterase